jgi:hypothetical protein
MRIVTIRAVNSSSILQDRIPKLLDSIMSPLAFLDIDLTQQDAAFLTDAVCKTYAIGGVRREGLRYTACQRLDVAKRDPVHRRHCRWIDNLHRWAGRISTSYANFRKAATS